MNFMENALYKCIIIIIIIINCNVKTFYHLLQFLLRILPILKQVVNSSRSPILATSWIALWPALFSTDRI